MKKSKQYLLIEYVDVFGVTCKVDYNHLLEAALLSRGDTFKIITVDKNWNKVK